MMMMNEMMRPVLTFDSGLGGLSVFRHLVAAAPKLDHIYVADDLSFPVGDWEEGALIEHCIKTIGGLISQYNPCLVVIACNTESTLIMAALRENFDIPFVGTVPAVKPAASQTQTGLVSVLATPGTVKRDYTRALMDAYASHCRVTLVGAGQLAMLAEAYMIEGFIDENAVLAEIEPCFVEDGDKKTDVVVLACTHYPLLLPVFEKLAPWPVLWLDPAPAIARQALVVLDSNIEGGGQRHYLMTSGAAFPMSAVDQCLL
ncbi:MAG: glutamate racemase [Hyphomicrobiales bacterium]